jgi:hypothetical protein
MYGSFLNVGTEIETFDPAEIGTATVVFDVP